MRPLSNISLEHEIAFGERATVMGIDEAGRGPLAGPVFAAAVHLPIALAEHAEKYQAVSGRF